MQNLNIECELTQNPFINAGNVLSCRHGHVKDFLQDIFVIAPENETLDEVLLEKTFLLACQTGISAKLAAFVFALSFDKNWHQTCKVMTYFLSQGPLTFRTTIYAAWIDIAIKFIKDPTLEHNQRIAIATDTLRIVEEALEQEPDSVIFLCSIAEVAIVYSDKSDQTYHQLVTKGDHDLIEMINVFKDSPQNRIHAKLLRLNFSYLTGNWQQTLEIYQSLSDLPFCECGGPNVSGLKYSIEFVLNKIKIGISA